MGEKFDMSDDALRHLGKKTEHSGDELTMLVRRLGEAAAPLEGRFNGQARAAFDKFKTRTDQVAFELNNALAGVLGGVVGMERAFAEGDDQGAADFSGMQANAAFDAARFGGR